MSSTKKGKNFLESEAGSLIRKRLKAMENDVRYNTPTSYSASSPNLPDSKISFTRKHMLYLSKHSDVNPEHYIANLRLKTKFSN